MLDCDLEVTAFEHKSSYYIHFRTYTLGNDVKSLVPTTMGQMESFFKERVGIK